MMVEKPSPEMMRALLDYHPETGGLTWRARPVSMFANNRAHRAWNARYAEKPGFTAPSKNGYLTGRIFDRTYFAHRIVWVIVHGEWPALDIDHINGNRADNRLCNLRHVSRDLNMRNARHPNRGSDQIGVRPCGKKTWSATIGVGSGKVLWLGAFPNREAAVAARLKAERDHGYHPNHGVR